jgi:ribosomal protein L2
MAAQPPLSSNEGDRSSYLHLFRWGWLLLGQPKNEKRRGRIVTIEYDPNQNAYICRIHYGDGEKRYILHPRRSIIGDTIVYGTKVPIKMVNALPLSVV